MSEWKINNKPSVWLQRRRCASLKIDTQVSRRAGIDLHVFSVIHKAERSGRWHSTSGSQHGPGGSEVPPSRLLVQQVVFEQLCQLYRICRDRNRSRRMMDWAPQQSDVRFPYRQGRSSDQLLPACSSSSGFELTTTGCRMSRATSVCELQSPPVNPIESWWAWPSPSHWGLSIPRYIRYMQMSRAALPPQRCCWDRQVGFAWRFDAGFLNHQSVGSRGLVEASFRPELWYLVEDFRVFCKVGDFLWLSSLVDESPHRGVCYKRLVSEWSPWRQTDQAPVSSP